MGDCVSQACYFFRRRIAGLGLLRTFESSGHGEKARQWCLWCDVCTVAPKARCYVVVEGKGSCRVSAQTRPRCETSSFRESEVLTTITEHFTWMKNTMSEISAYIGQRLSLKKQTCTVRYVGQVADKQGQWLGVEWDDASRGKHNGTHQGVSYFKCRLIVLFSLTFLFYSLADRL
jgi:hypothetical protein